MVSRVEWRMYVHMTDVSRCCAIKYNSRTQIYNVGPPTHLGFRVAMVVQQPKSHRSKDRVRGAWKWGLYIPTGRALIGCDPSPPNPWTPHVFGWTCNPHIDYSQDVPCLVDCIGCSCPCKRLFVST